MQTVYILEVKGWGDNEDAYYVTGAYSTKERAKQARNELIAEAAEDGLTDVETQIYSVDIDA